jgi:hypothetical protein
MPYPGLEEQLVVRLKRRFAVNGSAPIPNQSRPIRQSLAGWSRTIYDDVTTISPTQEYF